MGLPSNEWRKQLMLQQCWPHLAHYTHPGACTIIVVVEARASRHLLRPLHLNLLQLLLALGPVGACIGGLA
jgi:hypothetical protein